MCVDWIKYDINKFQWWRGWKWIKHEAVFLSFVLFSVTELGLRCLAVIHTSICAILNYVRTAGWQQTLQITGSTRGFTCADVKAGIWKCCILHCGVVNEKGVDLFIRILIRGAACCDSAEGWKVTLMLLIFHIGCIQTPRCTIAGPVDVARCIDVNYERMKHATNYKVGCRRSCS